VPRRIAFDIDGVLADTTSELVGQEELEPGTIARLATIAAERRWEVIFLTKRPESDGVTAQRQTQHWLRSKGYTLPSVFVVKGSRGPIAAALGLDIVVDARPEHCLDVVGQRRSRAQAVLVWRGDKAQLPSAARHAGISIVGSVGECLDILIRMDGSTPRVIDRVKRLFGLKEPVSV
jgi:hypothetical protein